MLVSKADDALKKVMSDPRFRESRVINSDGYSDEPIVRTGKDLFGDRKGRAARGKQRERDAESSHGRQHGRVEDFGREKLRERDADASSEQHLTSPSRVAIPSQRHTTKGISRITSRRYEPEQLKSPGIPERIKKMRSIAEIRDSEVWRPSRHVTNEIFYKQGKFMEDYEDDLPYDGTFFRYFPTYEDMSVRILRGYFTWRTRLRAGETPPVPPSFAYVYVYEILNGIGIEPSERGLHELERIRSAYASEPGFEQLDELLDRWEHDYVIYYGLDTRLLAPSRHRALFSGVTTLRRAEEALLAADADGVWSDDVPGAPTAGELLGALAATSSYRVERSKTLKDHREEYAQVIASVFAKMVDHCRRRRKKGYVDGLFEQRSPQWYSMFARAVFFQPKVHPDVEVDVGDGVVYRCSFGTWQVVLPCSPAQTSTELGDLLKFTDALVRERVGGLSPLKSRPLPKFQGRIAMSAVDDYFARREEEKATHVEFDFSKLGTIRQSSARTRDALLVDEECDDVPSAASASQPPAASRPPVANPPVSSVQAPADAQPSAAAPPDSQASFSVQSPASTPASTSPVLTSTQLSMLRALLDDTFDLATFERDGTMASLEADQINEAFLDVVGDTVIEFEGEEPRIVEDYEEDVRRVIEQHIN
jgi:hypothetical protein